MSCLLASSRSASVAWMVTSVRVFASKNSRSMFGTPSSDEITSEGTGRAKSATMSAVRDSRASIRSTQPSTISWTASRISFTLRTVNSGIRDLRNRMCSGESRPTNQPGTSSAVGTPPVRLGFGKPGWAGLELILGLVSTARTSSYRATSHTLTPVGR